MSKANKQTKDDAEKKSAQKEANRTESPNSKDKSSERKAGESGKSDKRSWHKDGNRAKDRDKRESNKGGKKLENDIEWYMHSDATLLDAAGRLSFMNPLGGELDRIGDSQPNITSISVFATDEGADDLRTVPGIMRVLIQPAFGVSEGPNSPLNIAARATYSRLQQTLSMKLSPTIEAPDLMCYFMAADSIFALYAYMCRLYGTIPYYNAVNRYMGRAMLRANGVDPDDIIANASNIRYFLRMYRAKINRMLKVPKAYGFLQRHSWLFTNYFSDAPVLKSQTYAYVPTGFYKWAPVKYETGTAAEFVEFTGTQSTPYTWEQVAAYANDLLDAMLTDDDAASITGFLLRAYGSDGCLEVTEIGDDFMTEPGYSEEILGQIHNSQSAGWRLGDNVTRDLDYHQQSGDDNYLIAALTASSSGADKRDIVAQMACCLPHLMDSFVDQPDVNEVVINSRSMMTATMLRQMGNYKQTITSCGLDIIWHYSILYMDPLTGNLLERNLPSLITATTPDTLPGPETFAAYTKFDWAPRCTAAKYDEGTDGRMTSITLDCDAWDFNNATPVSDSVLDKLHEAALLGALNIPVKVNAYTSMRD